LRCAFAQIRTRFVFGGCSQIPPSAGSDSSDEAKRHDFEKSSPLYCISIREAIPGQPPLPKTLRWELFQVAMGSGWQNAIKCNLGLSWTDVLFFLPEPVAFRRVYGT